MRDSFADAQAPSEAAPSTPVGRVGIFGPSLRDLPRRIKRLGLRRALPLLVNEGISLLLSRPFGLVHIVEYPKCGGSWIRNMVESLRGENATQYLGDRLLRPGDIVQGHWTYRPWIPRPVVVVRDPRDVFVSYYFHETRFKRREEKRGIDRYFRSDPQRPIPADFALYLEAKLGHRTDPPFSYRELLASWLGRPSVLWVRYEDCLTNPERQLARIAAHVGLLVDPARVRAAVEANRFENATRHRGLERKPGEAEPGEFERSGIAGDWRNHFNKRACELLEQYEGWTLRELGYESDAGWIERHLSDWGFHSLD